MNRTHQKPVKHGEPVTGVLPVIFNGITDPKSIDLRSVKVRFSDAIGDVEGHQKWWETVEPTSLSDLNDDYGRARPGLPIKRPVES